MSRFNTKATPMVGARSGVQTTGERVTNHEGRLGYVRTAKGELFTLAASFMGGDSNFYEKSVDRYDRLVSLVNTDEVQADPVWTFQFVRWLRNDANMRTVAMVVALEYVRGRLDEGESDSFRVLGVPLTNRDIVSIALQRADEPAEVIAYWLAKYGKTIPKPIKKGVEDAAVRLYNPFSFLKYGESRSSAVSMKDVIRLVHPEPKDINQSALFEYITSEDRNATFKKHTQTTKLHEIRARQSLMEVPRESRREFLRADTTNVLKRAGFTWENLSEWLPGGMDAEAWEAIIPNMGIMALIRNLRNFDEAGISKEMQRYVRTRIMDPVVVRESKQLPYRWYNAYRNTDSLTYAAALDEALDYSLGNVPKLKGRTLVLVDMSGSMFQGKVSDRSSVTYANVASLFGAVLKIRNPHGVDLYQFGSDYRELSGGYSTMSNRRLFSEYKPEERWTGVTKEIELRTGGSILRGMEKFQDMGGTETVQAVVETVKDHHDRVIIVTDEQGYRAPNYSTLPVPAGKSVYIWNLAGYKAGLIESGKYKLHTFAGLTDSAFQMIPILEAGTSVGWPWEVKADSND